MIMSFNLLTQIYCKIPKDKDHMQVFHYIAMIIGLLLFVLSFFNFAEILSEVVILFLLAVLGIFAAGCAMLYNVYMDFYLNCSFGNGYQSNIFEGNDYFAIGVFVMDLNCALLLISAAIAFSRIQ